MKRHVGFAAYPRALAIGLQWKLWLLWFVFTLIPALFVSRPLHGMLSGLMDHSVHATTWARGFNGLAMTDVIVDVARHGGSMLGPAAALGMLLTLLLSPFLTGMAVTAARALRRPGFGELMHGGLGEYWRLFRFMLWAFLLLGLAFAIGVAGQHVASHHADHAVLQSQADLGNHIATAVTIVMLVVAHSMVEAGRGQIVADPGLRSATRAFLRGIGTLLRRPLMTLGMYVGVSVIGYVLVLLLGMWRVRVVAAGWGGFVLALLVTLLIVAAMAWMRTARLAAMGAVAQATPARRRSGKPALSPA